MLHSGLNLELLFVIAVWAVSHPLSRNPQTDENTFIATSPLTRHIFAEIKMAVFEFFTCIPTRSSYTVPKKKSSKIWKILVATKSTDAGR